MDTKLKQKVIELSISRNYVCNWGLWEAMREILQNAQDADSQGHPMHILYANDKSDIIISNEDIKLPIESLVLGNSTKQDDSTQIGKYGEGYKLALVVLLRLGYQVNIMSGEDMWIPFFDKSKSLNTEVLKIKILKGYNTQFMPGNTTFTIHGLKYNDIQMLKEKSLEIYKLESVTGSLGKTLECDYGSILMDPQFKGKFYVEGLYIQTDNTFKYGYSFKNEYVNLDRDRRAINYYDLLELTTNSLLSQTEDVTIVETCLTSKEKDIKNLTDFYNEIPQDFAVGYAKYFLEKHDLDEDTFIGTEKETLVSGSSKVFVTDKQQARMVNQGLNKQAEYERVKELAKEKDNVDVAWEYYHKHSLYLLHNWLLDNCKKLTTKQINKFIEATENIKPDCYSLIKDDVINNLLTEINQKKSYKKPKKVTPNSSILPHCVSYATGEPLEE